MRTWEDETQGGNELGGWVGNEAYIEVGLLRSGRHRGDTEKWFGKSKQERRRDAREEERVYGKVDWENL